ncbi:MAG: class I SAM-dependent methyltransferase [Candidatus Brocadia sp.]
MIVKPERILDLGCGTGENALVLARSGYRITGVDRSASILEIARRKAKVGRQE